MPKIHALPAMTTLAPDDVVAFDDISTTNDDTKKVTAAQIAGFVYPIGTHYTNETDSTNPGTLFGIGTWVAVANRMIIGKGSGSFATAGATGGAETHTLTTAEMPSHTHSLASGQNQWLRGGTGDSAASLAQTGAAFRVQITNPTDATGSGGAHNNMPPYIVAYIWKRTA